jgi:hypothetical protein
MTNYTSTAADRIAYKAEAARSNEFPFGSAEWTRHQNFAADAIVSCYTGSDGERQHETRTDGSCRCGKYAVQADPWHIVVSYTYQGRSLLATYAPLAAHLRAARNLARAEFIRTHMSDAEITEVRTY